MDETPAPRPHARAPMRDSLVDALLRRREFTDLYLNSRIPIARRRIDIPREVPLMPPFNQWSANQPGTTYFLPVAELTALYINLLLAGFSREPGVLMVDERNRYRITNRCEQQCWHSSTTSSVRDAARCGMAPWHRVGATA